MTRKSAPFIFEDAEDPQDGQNICAVPTKRPLRQPSKPKTTKSKGQTQRTKSYISEDIEITDATPTSQDENCPPVEFVTSTPSANRFENVIDTLPSTPKHRVRVFGGLLTPRTPRSTTEVGKRSQNVYARARQLFAQSASPCKLVGRDAERQQLKDFVDNANFTRRGGCTYISGPPGTGKSALVHEVLQEYKDDSRFQVSVINCVGMRSATQVYDKMINDLAPGMVSRKSCSEKQLQRLFTTKSSTTTYLVMLDEIDSLLDAECETLYSIFEWALHPSSCLTLIGIANALDLTDRFLPRLKSKGLKPQLLPFLPYTALQVSTIITDKLRTLLTKDTTVAADFVPCMHPAAIQLCSKKIAAQTGDLRKAFSLIRRTIDQVEKDCIAKQDQNSPVKQALAEVHNAPVQRGALCKMSPGGQLQDFTPENAPRANIAHVAKLASSIFNNGTTSRLVGLNLQQKAVLCSIVNKENSRQKRDLFITPTKLANKAPTVGELFTKYMSLCRQDDGLLQPLKDTEFRDVVASLETLGLVHESKMRSSSLLSPGSSSRSGRNHNERQIASAVTEKEMSESLTGPGADLLRRLLNER